MATADAVTMVLADDDEDVRSALRQLFEAVAGIEVVAEVSSAAEAVAACAAHAPDVALVDLRMPGGGLEATRQITATVPTKVVVLTAHETPENRTGAATNGAARFVVKSAGDDLVRAVLEAVGR